MVYIEAWECNGEVPRTVSKISRALVSEARAVPLLLFVLLVDREVFTI